MITLFVFLTFALALLGIVLLTALILVFLFFRSPLLPRLAALREERVAGRRSL